MAAPTLIDNFGSSFTFGGANSLTASPAATPSADEIIILRYSANGISTSATAFSWPSGFTQIYNNTFSSIQTAVAWKRAGGSEPSSYTLNYTAGSGGNERLLGARFTGCVTSGSPIDDDNTQTFSFPGTSFSAGGGMTASTADTLHCIIVNSDGNLQAPAISGYAETVYNTSPGGSSFAMDSRAFFTDGLTSAGAVADQTVTHAGSGFFNVAVYSFLLLPDAGNNIAVTSSNGIGAVGYAVTDTYFPQAVTPGVIALPRRTYFILQ